LDNSHVQITFIKINIYSSVMGASA